MKTKLNILRGIDTEFAAFFGDAVQYMSKIAGVDIEIKAIDTLPNMVTDDEFFVFFLDEVSVGNSIDIIEPFLQQQVVKNRIIFILDNIEADNMPPDMQYYQTFIMADYSYLIDEEINSTYTAKEKRKEELYSVISDVIFYIKRIVHSESKKDQTVFIGPSDGNTTYYFQKVIRELLHRDYNIVPEIINPTAKELLENREYLLSMLKGSNLAIHFIGHNSLKQYPLASTPALLINKIVSDYCNTPQGKTLQRIIYLPEETGVADEELVEKIMQFKSDSNNLISAELVQTPVEKFKEIVLQKLLDIKEYRIGDINNSCDLYLIIPPGKEKEAKPYIEILKSNKLNISTSITNLDRLDMLNYHQQQLISCKGVVVFDMGSKQWFNRKISDIKKAPGWGRTTEFSVKLIIGEVHKFENSDNFIFINGLNDMKSLDFGKML